jgi:succinate dehydrogenase/fumarate reductase flavoprotein subunit
VGHEWDLTADVMVVGQGAAGCAAAIEAHDAGAQVIVLEKMPAGSEGGNTRVSGGCWFDNTDAERAAVYLRNLCGDRPIPDSVIRVWAAETYRNSEWVASLGAAVAHNGEYPPEYPEVEGSDCYGGYMAVNGQMGEGQLLAVLSEALRQRGVEVHLDTPARRLVQAAEGAVVGVVADRGGRDLRVQARRGVVLATGGFEANPEMVRDYLGLPGSPAPWGSPGGTGDGLRMALQAGADLWHMTNMMTVPGLKVPGFESGFYTPFWGPLSYLYVGPDGTRFVDETTAYRHGHALMHGRYELYPTQPMYVIFDEKTRRAGPISPGTDVLPVGWNLLVEGYRWSDDNRVEIDKGWISTAPTVEALAGVLGVDPDGLAETVRQYNADCQSGSDRRFGRDPSTLVPLSEPPFYGFPWGPLIGWSNGGPRRNEHSQVLTPAGTVIGRLYAAGCVSSTYSWCKDGGFHIADALAFGRVAGRGAAAETPTT